MTFWRLFGLAEMPEIPLNLTSERLFNFRRALRISFQSHALTLFNLFSGEHWHLQVILDLIIVPKLSNCISEQHQSRVHS